MITVFHLPFLNFPFVKGLIHHQESHLVAEIKKFGRGRVVCRPDGIASHFFQQLQAPFPCLFGNCCPKTSCIVMEAHTVDLEMPSIEKKALVLIERNCPNAKSREKIVFHFCPFDDGRSERIERRLVNRPQRRRGDLDGLFDVGVA